MGGINKEILTGPPIPHWARLVMVAIATLRWATAPAEGSAKIRDQRTGKYLSMVTYGSRAHREESMCQLWYAYHWFAIAAL